MNDFANGLRDAVRRQLNDPAAEVRTVSKSGFDDGFADAMTGGDGVNLHSGVARSRRGDVEFRLVSKTCSVFPQGADPKSWLYWKRETLAYESGVLNDLSAGIVAPRCFGVVHPSPSTSIIFMDAVEDCVQDWSLDTYARAGHALGMFNAANLRKPLKRYDWMVPSRATAWVNEARSTLNALDDLKDDPILSRWLSGSCFERTRALWAKAGHLQDAVRQLPRCLCHHDAFKRNLMMPPVGGPNSSVVAIDWAFVGPGVVGEELAALIGVSLKFMEVDMADARRLERRVFNAYVSGLRHSGWDGSTADVRLGFTATTALMLGLGAPGPWLPLLRDPEFEPVIEKIVGISKEIFIRRLSALQTYLLDLGEEAMALTDG